MKKFLGFILIGLLIRHGSADVSHLSKHDHRNGYLPPHPAHNLFIEQDNNGINSKEADNEVGHQPSQYPSQFDNENPGYLPPYQELPHYHNHDHQHFHQQEERGYLPPELTNQEQARNNIHNEHQHLDTNRGYLPPGQIEQSHGQEKQDNHNHQDDRGYLPPHHEQVEVHDQHHNAQQHEQDGVDPNLQISYYNNYAIALQQNHEPSSKDSNPNEEYEDNSNGYDYSPPNHGFKEGHHQHHHQTQQKDSLIGGPQSAVNVVPTSQNSLQNPDVQPHQEVHQDSHHQTTEESHTQSNLKQNIDFNVNQEYQNEEPHQQQNEGYLPPSPSSQEHSQTNLNQAQDHEGQIQGNEESHQGDERGYLPPIGALELPQSSDTLHIVPPSQLGLPIQKSKNKPETNHINVPLPLPQLGYYFIPAVVTQLPSLTETKTENLSSDVGNIPPIEGQLQNQQQHHQQYQQQQQQQHQLSTNEIPPASEFSIRPPSTPGFRIIPSVQTAQAIASQGYLTPSQIVAQHQYFADIVDFSSPNSNHLEFGQHNFPPFIQTQPQGQFANNQQQLKQNQNEVQNTHQQEYESQSSFEDFVHFSAHGIRNEQNQISRPLELSDYNNQKNAYLPPIDDQNQVDCSNQQSEAGIHNQEVTNTQTFMDNVNQNDRFDSLQFQPKQAIESNSPPLSPPLVLSKPSAVEAYAPGTYKVSTNVPFNSFTQADGYLPPVGGSTSEDNQPKYSSSIGFELNEEAKKDLAPQTAGADHDNSIFPIADIFGVQDDEMSQIMKQLQGHIRTLQITNHQDHSVNNIKVQGSSSQAGVRTIEILGEANEDPMGEHKVLHVISKDHNPQVIDQTIKIFKDRKELVKAAPTNSNEYLPPSTIDTNIRQFRRRY